MIGLAVLGSTGSIGGQTLEVVRRLGDRFEVRALAAGRASDGFAAQLAAWPQARVWCAGGRPAGLAAERWAGGLEELATLPGVELVVVATTGMAALPAVLAALRSGRRVALANKETLVAGGHLVDTALEARGGERLDLLRPIDSEHSAIWQCLVGERLDRVARLILTASGGPFRDRRPAELGAIGPAEALAHPTWRMGPKITVDSATLVNKAFEAIEAKWLYRVPYPRIDAVIHPQSVVHSLVEFVDGSFKAQLGMPDMRLPIQYALTWPDRAAAPAPVVPPAAWPSLEFAPLESERFPAYRVVREAAAAGGNRGAVVNAADEVAVAAFLGGKLPFTGIATLIERAVSEWGSDDEPALDTLVALDQELRASLGREVGVVARR